MRLITLGEPKGQKLRASERCELNLISTARLNTVRLKKLSVEKEREKTRKRGKRGEFFLSLLPSLPTPPTLPTLPNFIKFLGLSEQYCCPTNGGEYHPKVDKTMVVGNEVTRIFTLGQWSIAQVVNQDENSENIR